MKEEIQPKINNCNEDEISLKEVVLKLKEWWFYLLTKWKIILTIGLLGGCLGLTYAFFKKTSYTAKLTFALEEEKGGALGAYSGLASQFGIDLGGATSGAFYGDNLLELMKSRSMIEKTLLSPINTSGKTTSFADYYLSFSGLRDKWADDEILGKIEFPCNSDRKSFTRLQDSILYSITENLKKKCINVEKTDKKLSVIEVTCKSSSEIFSKNFAEGLVKQVTEFYITTKTGRSQKSINALQIKADSLRKELNKAMYGRAAATDQVLNLNPARQVALVPSQYKAADIQVLGAAYGEVVKNLEISKMALMRETPFIQIIDVPIFPLEANKPNKILLFILGSILTGFLISLIFLIKYITKSLLR